MGPSLPRGSLVSKYNDVTALDHLIGDHGGTTRILVRGISKETNAPESQT